METNRITPPSPRHSDGSNSYKGSPTVSMHSATKKGILKKKGGFFSSWKDSWFVLEGSLLLEYRSETSSKPLKVISLEKYNIKLAESITGTPFSFVLVSSVQKEPIFLLAANEPEQVEWVAALASRCQESSVDWGTDYVLEAFNDPVIQASERGVIIGVNEPALKLFGYKKSEMVGRPLGIIMTADYSSEHDRYLQGYLESGVKKLIGKPRKLPAVRADGTKIVVSLSLGEVFSGGIRKFIATMRPEETKKYTQESLKANFERTVDKAIEQASLEIKSSLVTEVQSLLAELETLRSKNRMLKKHTKQHSEEDTKATEKHDSIVINLKNLHIQERLADTGGSGAVVFNCIVDGFGCVMKELDLKGVNKDLMENFMSEIALLEALPYHNNLARYLFHSFTETKLRLFTTRYAMNLTHLIVQKKRENKRFSFEEMVKMMLDIVRGLEVLHGNNIIHRDLKSDNIFVTLNQLGNVEYLVIGDFDTAKMVDENVAAKTTIGTPGYMAPEILKSKGQAVYGFPVDIWSLGMLMFELMALQRPFSERNSFTVSELNAQGIIPTVSEYVKQNYQKLLPLWEKCLAVNAKDRPTVAECKQALLQIHP